MTRLMAGVFRAELAKVRTLPATWIAVALAGGANVVLAVVAASGSVRIAGPDGPVAVGRIGTLMLLPAYVFAAVAVFAAGSEYRGGQLRVSLAAVPHRHRLAAAKLAAAAGVSLLTGVPVVLPHLVAGTAGPLPLLAAYLLLALIGYGFAVVARGVVVPLAVLAVTPVVLSPALRPVLPGLVRLLPHEAALSLAGVPGGGLSPAAGLLVLTCWTAVSLGAAWTLFARRDS